jgi:hypothetical protein|tara:strand:+ start:258 stop:476 length:219 start_codon:yes stop_codon:yes gene_type:complete
LHDLLDLARQLFEAERLGQKMDIGAAVETLARGLLGTARNTDDLDLRPVFLGPLDITRDPIDLLITDVAMPF